MKVFSAETRKKMSEAAKRRCTPEWRAKQIARGTPLPFDVVKSMYDAGHTQEEIGKHFGVSQKVVWRFMKRHGLKARVAVKRAQWGKNNSNYKGGGILGRI